MWTVNLPDVFLIVIAQHSRILQSFSTSDMVVSIFSRTLAEALCARIRDTDAGVRSAATSILPTLELEEFNVEGSSVPRCSQLALVRHRAVDQLGRKGDESVSAEPQERTKMGAWMACLQD